MNWCAFFRVYNVEFQAAPAASNRRVLERAVHTTADEGRAPGLMAYREGEPIGWVSLGPREEYERLQHSRVLSPIDERPVWSIVCFVVARSARKQGVAHAMLEAAIAPLPARARSDPTRGVPGGDRWWSRGGGSGLQGNLGDVRSRGL